MGRWLTAFFLAGTIWLGAGGPAAAQIEGNYDAIGPLPKKHSLKVVRFDEYLNFTCPHCNNFRAAAKPLKEKYRGRIKVTYLPVLFRGQTDGPLRLFFVAQAAGRTEEIKNLIFDAAFKSGVNIYDPAIVSYLARSSGLGERFRKEAGAEWVTKKVLEARRQASSDGVSATPTVVLERALRVTPRVGMDAYVGNLDRLIGQLLRR